MRPADLLREALGALAGSRSRTLLTGTGITVGTLALTLILSLSLGLSTVIDEIVSSDQQLRQVVVMPGFGKSVKRDEVPQVEGEMSEAKRARLRRTLKKRRHRGPPVALQAKPIDATVEAQVLGIAGVEMTLPLLQDRFEVSLGADDARVALDRPVLSMPSTAANPYYPQRILAGRWFESDDEPGVVVHELLLYDLGLTSDEQQAGVVGRSLHVISREATGQSAFAAMLFGGGTSQRRSTAPIVYEDDIPILGVVRERFGNEPGSVVDESVAMHADLLFPAGFARELWDRHEQRPAPRGMLVMARTLDDVEGIEEAVREMGLRPSSVRTVVDRIRRMLTGVTVVAMFLAGIAVFVSALGIVNTMVMSVLERTREIGLLKSLGATHGDVAALFLTEAGLLGLGGGVVGVVLSFGLSLIGDHFGGQQIEKAFLMPFEGSLFKFPWWLAAGGLAFATGTALLAAVVPALRAARIDPVRALRHE